jgi:DNA-binding response OmpR family regulator
VSRGATPRGRVIIVDDEPGIRLLCKVNLEADGFEVEDFADGRSAVEAARRAPPDVFLLDVMIPGEDGLSIAARIRAEPALSHVPCVFLTARADLGEDERLRRAGAAGCITKPFNPVALADALDEILGRADGIG